MNTIPNRMAIYAKDVVNITGRKDRTARKLLDRIRKKYKKKKSDFITIEEFCAYTGFREEKIALFLV